MTSPQENVECVSCNIETKSNVQIKRNYRIELNMEKIHQHILLFKYGTRNLWRLGQ